LCWLLFPAIAVPVGLVARRRGHPQVLRRFMPWLVIVPVTLTAAFAGPTAFLCLLVACDVGASWELARLVQPNRTAAPFLIAVAASLPWLVWAHLQPAVPAIWFAAALAAAVAVHAPRTAPPAGLRAATLGAGLGAGLSYWTSLERMPSGSALVLVAFSVVAIHDVMGYAVGRLVGGYRPFARLSPGKTLAGYAGGVCGALFVVNLLFFALPGLDWRRRALAGLVLALAASLGDLAASAVKRRYGAKDFGSLLGPQGGLLDRLDSLIGAGCAFYWFVI